MASVYITYPCTFIPYNMNNNNNDKSNNPYPLVLSKARSSTAASANPSSVATTINVSKSELNSQHASPVGDSHLECDHKVDSEGESNISEDRGEATLSTEIMTEPVKRVTRRQQRQMEIVSSSPVADEVEPVPLPKPRGRRGRRKKGSVLGTPKKVQRASLKTCVNCGTVADKVKAKKCHKCQKFFFDHWARRCRIPPCPNCHFSRKARGGEAVPQFCERCGHTLKGDADNEKNIIGEASSLLGEGDSASDASSFQLSEDFHDVDNLSHSRDSDYEDEDEECTLPDNMGSETSHPDMGKAIKYETNDYSNTTHDSVCESLADEEQDSIKSCDLPDMVCSDMPFDLTEKSCGSTGSKEKRDTCDKSDDTFSTCDEINPPPLPGYEGFTTGEKDINNKLPISSDTTESKVALQESKDSVHTKGDELAELSMSEPIFPKLNDAASNIIVDRGAHSTPSKEIQIVSINDDSMESSPSVMLKSTDSTKEAESNNCGLVVPVYSNQTAFEEQSQSGSIVPASDLDANFTMVKDQVLLEKITDDIEQEITSNENSIDFNLPSPDVRSYITEEEGAEPSPSLGILKSHQMETPTLVSVKQRKRADSPKFKSKSSKKSTKSMGKKVLKKRSMKLESTLSTPDYNPVSTPGVAVVPPLLHSPNQDVIDTYTLIQPTTHTVNSNEQVNPVPMISAHEVEALRSVQGTSGMQTEQESMTQLLRQAQNLGMTMTSSMTGLQPLLKNLMENLKQQFSQQKEDRSSSLELLHQRLLSEAGENSLQSGSQQQSSLIHQRLKLSQQCQRLINQLQSQVTEQRQIKATAMLLNQSSNLAPSCAHLPQNICIPGTVNSEATLEEIEPMPSSSKKLNTLLTGKVTSSKGTTLKAFQPVTLGTSVVSGSSDVVDQKDHCEAQKVAQVVFQHRVDQSSSKLVPRSSSLPPQLVPSSSLLRQESDDDMLTSSFPLSSTPCLSHTLQPPPLKPTPPTDANNSTVNLLPVVSSSIPLSSLSSVPPGLKLVSGCSDLVPLQSASNLPPQSVNISSNVEDTSSVVSGREPPVIARVCSANVISSMEVDVSPASSHMTGSEHFQFVKPVSQSLSLSPSQAAGSFHRLEIGSPPPISGQSNKIRVSLLKPEEEQGVSLSSVTATSSNSPQSPIDSGPPTTVGSVAFPGKFQNFALAPNLSVIATVETQTKMQASAGTQISRLSPTNSESTCSSDLKPPQLKSDSQELQRSLENCSNAGKISSRQCTPEEIEEMSCNIQKRITSVLTGSTSIGSLTPTSLSQPQQPQVPSLMGPVPSVTVPGRGAVSITVIKSTAQSESDSPYSNASVQTTTTDKGPASPFTNALPVAVSASSSIVTESVMMPNFMPPVSVSSSLAQTRPYMLNKDVAGLPSVGVQAAHSPTFKKIAPRKPAPSGIVTIQVCNTVPSSNSVTATKMTSQSVGVGTESSVSQTAGVHITPSIVRPRPSAQIGGVLVTPQPSVGHMNSLLPSNGHGVLRNPAAAGGSNGEAHVFPSSPPSRSVYVTKLYSNAPPSAAQPGPQSYNPHSRSGLKELSSPAFEEALLSAAKMSSNQIKEEQEKKEKPPKKERKKSGKLKTKEGGKMSGKGKRSKGKFQGDKREKFQTDKALARLMSEEVLENESDQTSETGSHNGDKKKPSDSGEHDDNSEGGEDDVPKEDSNRGDGENENEENEDERGGNGDKPLKKHKNGSKKDSMKQLLYSVKLKDCFLHHVMWQDYRVVLLVPLDASGSVKQESPSIKVKLEGGETTPSPEKKRRRKSKIEPLDIHEIEAEMDPLVESPATSSVHIHSPCFSMYELRNKLFSESNAVYAYTYKNQIKTLKSPLHWIHVLKRMGGMHEHCHSCRLLDVSDVIGINQHYGNSSTLPLSLDDLCKNDLPKGRKVIDLSLLNPEDLLESGQIEEIPQCSFLEKESKRGFGSNSSRKRQKKQLTQTSAKKPHRDPGHETLDDSFDQSIDMNQSFDLVSSQSDHGDDGFEQSHDPHDPDDEEEEGSLVTTHNVHEKYTTATFRSTQRSPPPLIKHSSPSSSSSKNAQKKKFCPDCDTPIARKCKKCPTCGKRFGVFTFGRKLCPGCGRVNLARMTACYECGHSMQFAQKALPKYGAEVEVTSNADHRSEYVFGSRKRRRVPALPYSIFSPDAIKTEPDSRLPSIDDDSDIYDGDAIDSEGRVRDADDTAAMYDALGVHSSTKSKSLGYQYGRVTWGDTDITCLVDENGTPKVCLQELCSKVLRNQVKADVFDMVKNLNLPVFQGDTALLKKLQALGLHSNRSPICRLIAAEELWTLLDALQEPVPEEVHRHLENTASTTTLMMQSPSHIADGGSDPVMQSPGLVAGGSALIDEDDHGFESTLHEVECSDGQYISILRTWNGEQYTCLTEIWKKYFPEVNRNHLTSALKRLGLDTHMPTGQQATLLRSAGVISLRGAAGRLMRLEDTQILLEDFGIPLQVSSSSDIKEKSDVHAPPPPSLPPPRPLPMKFNSGTSVLHISRRKMSAPGCFTNHMISPAVNQEFKEDTMHAQCMRNILTAISYEDLVKLLEKSRDDALFHSTSVDEDASAATAILDRVQQLIYSRRELCNILSSEIGYLTASNHAYMAEVVRLNHSGKQILQDLESSLQTFNISL